MLLMIDNYDSFTYNLVQYFGELGQDVQVYRNDEITLEQIEALKPQYLVVSLGPCSPREAGISVAAIQHFAGKLPIMGVCLGHQAICEYYGGTVGSAGEIIHGKSSLIDHSGQDMFSGFANPLPVARYHSLVATYVPDELEVVAHYKEMPMAVLHRADRVLGFQFHPESIMTTEGARLLTQSLAFITTPETAHA